MCDKISQRHVINFSAGPAMMPLDVLQKAQVEFLNYENTDSSVMELSHRSATFEKIIKKAEQDLRDIL
jgi:phosphoserine aminotransferase